MRDPARIDEVLAEVKRVWDKHPDLRLGQLMVNALHVLVGEERGMTDGELTRRLFNLEERAFLDGLRKLDAKLDRVHSRQEA